MREKPNKNDKEILSLRFRARIIIIKNYWCWNKWKWLGNTLMVRGRDTIHWGKPWQKFKTKRSRFVQKNVLVLYAKCLNPRWNSGVSSPVHVQGQSPVFTWVGIQKLTWRSVMRNLGCFLTSEYKDLSLQWDSHGNAPKCLASLQWPQNPTPFPVPPGQPLDSPPPAPAVPAALKSLLVHDLSGPVPTSAFLRVPSVWLTASLPLESPSLTTFYPPHSESPISLFFPRALSPFYILWKSLLHSVYYGLSHQKAGSPGQLIFVSVIHCWVSATRKMSGTKSLPNKHGLNE